MHGADVMCEQGQNLKQREEFECRSDHGVTLQGQTPQRRPYCKAVSSSHRASYTSVLKVQAEGSS